MSGVPLDVQAWLICPFGERFRRTVEEVPPVDRTAAKVPDRCREPAEVHWNGSVLVVLGRLDESGSDSATGLKRQHHPAVIWRRSALGKSQDFEGGEGSVVVSVDHEVEPARLI